MFLYNSSYAESRVLKLFVFVSSFFAGKIRRRIFRITDAKRDLLTTQAPKRELSRDFGGYFRDNHPDILVIIIFKKNLAVTESFALGMIFPGLADGGRVLAVGMSI